MMASITALSRSLQGDGWWYSPPNDWYTRLWDDEMQYGQIRDGKFERIYPNVHVENGEVFAKQLKTLDDGVRNYERKRAENEANGKPFAWNEAGDMARTVHFRQVPANATILDRDGEMVTYLISLEPTMADVAAGLAENKNIMIDEEWQEEMRMALRDQFAMRALTPLVMSSDPKSAAIRAYQYADAMMIAREMKR